MLIEHPYEYTMKWRYKKDFFKQTQK